MGVKEFAKAEKISPTRLVYVLVLLFSLCGRKSLPISWQRHKERARNNRRWTTLPTTRPEGRT